MQVGFSRIADELCTSTLLHNAQNLAVMFPRFEMTVLGIILSNVVCS